MMMMDTMVLFLLCILPVMVQSFPTTTTIGGGVVRFDRTSIASHQFNPHYQSTTPTLQKNLQQRQRLPIDESFRFNLTCSGVTQSQCSLARQALRNAGHRIAQELEIVVPITVRAFYFPFCPATNKQCSESSTLGGAVYGSAFAATRTTSGGRRDRQVYMYPQALVKQLQKDVEVEYSDADIISQFNADFPYYFPNTTSTDQGGMNPNETDFEYVAVHELTHGLGFGTGLLEYSSVYRGGNGYLAPAIFSPPPPPNTGTTVANDNRIYSYLNPLDIFDAFVRDPESFQSFGQKLAQLKPLQAKSIIDFVRLFQSNAGIMEAARGLFQISTRGSEGIRFVPDSSTQPGQEIPLFTPTRYTQGSSLSHVDPRLANTSDFLMIPALRAGIELNEMVRRWNRVYGMNTLAMLQSIGWNQRNHRITIVRDYGMPGYVNPLSSTTTHSIHTTILIMLLLII
jgi:hypothetical protein